VVCRGTIFLHLSWWPSLGGGHQELPGSSEGRAIVNFPRRFYTRILKKVLDENDLDVKCRCLYQWRDNESLWPKHFWFRSIEEMEDQWLGIEDLNHQGYDIHFTVVPR
jgi:hypothetical protein